MILNGASPQVLLGVYGLRHVWREKFPPRHQARSPALDEISFEVHRGEIKALLGPNGSGKSTLMKRVAGVLPGDSPGCDGQVRYLGQDFFSLSSLQRAQKVAYVGPELRTEFPLTAKEVVLLGRTARGGALFRRNAEDEYPFVQEAMERCLCWDLRERDMDDLSGGERQLVALARALAQGAKVLFLDEALSKMDLNHQVQIGKLLRDLVSKGYSILLVSHDINLASEWADSALLLKAGKKIHEGPIRSVLTQEQMNILYPGASLMVGVSPVNGAPKVFFGKYK